MFVAFPPTGVMLKYSIFIRIIPPFMLLSLSTSADASVNSKYSFASALVCGVLGFWRYADITIRVMNMAVAVASKIHLIPFLRRGCFLFVMSPFSSCCY